MQTTHLTTSLADRGRDVAAHETTLFGGGVTTTTDPYQIEHLVSKVIAPHRLSGEFARGGFESKFGAVTMKNVTLGFLTYGQSVSLEIPTDSLTDLHINIPLTGSARTMYRHQIVNATPLVGALYNPGDVATIDWDRHCSQMCLKYSSAALEQALQNLLDRPLDRPVEFTRSVDCSSPDGLRWLNTVKLIHQSTSLIDHPVLTSRLEQIVIDGLLFTQRHTYSEELHAATYRQSCLRPKSVQKVIDAIEADPLAITGVSDLARIAGLSVRALQLAFQQSVGVSPITYVRDVRLNGARRHLQQADAGTTTVSQIAHEWGFLNPGRFSALYAKRFGETPSHTLRGGRSD